jgi:hypothetical protein
MLTIWLTPDFLKIEYNLTFLSPAPDFKELIDDFLDLSVFGIIKLLVFFWFKVEFSSWDFSSSMFEDFIFRLMVGLLSFRESNLKALIILVVSSESSWSSFLKEFGFDIFVDCFFSLDWAP